MIIIINTCFYYWSSSFSDSYQCHRVFKTKPNCVDLILGGHLIGVKRIENPQWDDQKVLNREGR